MTERDRILVTPRSLTRDGLAAVDEFEPLRRRGFELVAPWRGRLPEPRELAEALPGTVGWLAGIEPIGADLLDRADRLRVISRNGVGVDNIDLDAADRAGIRVARAVGANARGVAELVVTLTLCALRHVVTSAADLRTGRWTRHEGGELADRTVGIVGLGDIGSLAADLFRAMGAEVVGHDPFRDESPVPLLDLPELLARCDVVSLNCPPRPDGHPIVSAAALTLVAPTTVLVNTARASLVDDDAVLTALRDGRLSAYAVDAYDEEPPAPSGLLGHERVIATPHLGGYTTSSMHRAAAQAVENLLAHLDTA